MPERPASSSRQSALICVMALTGVMWLAELVDLIAGGDLDALGIEPRTADGLVGVLAAPLLHGGFTHLVANTVPLVLLGAIIALSGLTRTLGVLAVVVLVGGLGTWLTGPQGTVHIGASGVVFGFASYLIFRGVFSRHPGHLAVGVLVCVVYGTTLLVGLVPTPGVSWQGHLFGAVGGVVAARVLDRRAATPAHPTALPAAAP